jgi:hypothetical protein
MRIKHHATARPSREKREKTLFPQELTFGLDAADFVHIAASRFALKHVVMQHKNMLTPWAKLRKRPRCLVQAPPQLFRLPAVFRSSVHRLGVPAVENL